MKKVYKIKESKKSFFRINPIDIIIIIFFLVSIYLIYNLYEIQVIRGEIYNQKVIAQNKNYFSQNIRNRGEIFFKSRDELVAVAIQKSGYSLALVPKNFRDSEKVFDFIKNIVEIDKKTFLRIKKTHPEWKEFPKRFTEKEVKKLVKTRPVGVVFTKKSWRKYPFNHISSEIIGFLSYYDNKLVGRYGLEKYYNNVLKRDKNFQKDKIFDLFFNQRGARNFLSQKKISREGNIIGSIDIEVSKFALNILEELNEKYQSEYSGIIINRPSTGEIIAMVSTNNEKLDFNKKKQSYKNIFVERRYEFGSIFKPFVGAVGLETKSITVDFNHYNKGCIRVRGHNICNFDRKGRGADVNLEEIIIKSLNTGFVEVMREIGYKEFLNFLLDAGLEGETNIDLPGELSSNLNSLNTLRDIDFATASFGQGISFTPIGIMRMLSSLANNGYLVTPHIITKVKYGNLIPSKKFIPEKKRIFSEKTIFDMTNILINRAEIKDRRHSNRNYSVATKTGTAQVAHPDGGYYEDRVNHFLFGFFPAMAEPEDRFAILLFTTNPQKERFAVTTLTKPFYKVINFLNSYYNIQPDRPFLNKPNL